jgi:hypothetical protein
MGDILITLILCLIIVIIMAPLVAGAIVDQVEAACQSERMDPGLCRVAETAGLTTPVVEGETP